MHVKEPRFNQQTQTEGEGGSQCVVLLGEGEGAPEKYSCCWRYGRFSISFPLCSFLAIFVDVLPSTLLLVHIHIHTHTHLQKGLLTIL
jgi:hypothetical protein